MAERVAVIGAGQMGNGIAHVFAQSGFDVTMIDVSADALARGRETIAANLDRQIKKGTLPASDKDAILGRVTTAETLGAASDAALVVEAATENRDLKFKIFPSSTGRRNRARFSPRTRARSRSPRSAPAPSARSRSSACIS